MDFQTEKVVRQLQYAYENVEFFRKYFEDCGILPSDIKGRDDLAKLPLTRKHHYREHFPAGIVAKGYKINSPGVFRARSSGTTNESLVTLIHRFDLAERFARLMDVNPRYSFVRKYTMSRELRTAQFAAPNCSDVECANPNTTMKDRISSLITSNTLVLPSTVDLLSIPKKMVDMAVQELSEYRPQLLHFDPTHLAFLIRELKRRNTTLPYVEGVTLNFSFASRTSVKQIHDFFQDRIPIHSFYGMSEMGVIGLECPLGHMHLNSDSFVLEWIGSHGEVATGEVGELTLTPLKEQVIPHVRYATGDFFRKLGRCDCGHRFPRVRFEYRQKNVIQRKNGFAATTQAVDELVGAPMGLLLYQFEHIDENVGMVKCIVDESFDNMSEKEISARILKAFGGDYRLNFEYINYISTERSGKFSYMKINSDTGSFKEAV